MVKASGQIEQELRLLQDKTEAMADALEPLYEGYLRALSEGSKRQLVQAAYHLCTQAYPDKFLALSWDKRNQLQRALQTIATQIHEQLTQQRERSKAMSRQQQNNDGLAFLQRLLEARAASGSLSEAELSGSSGDDFDDDFEDFEELQSEGSPSGSEGRRRDEYGDELFAEEYEASFEGDSLYNDHLDDDSLDNGSLDEDIEGEDEDDDIDFEMEVPPADQRLSLDEEEDLLAALEGLARRSMEIKGEIKGGSAGPDGDRDDESSEDKGPLTPIHLVKQQMLLEKAIRDVFKAVSEEVNELLQAADVMPNFPKALMAAASDPRGMGEPINAVPNVVKMSVRVMHGEAVMESDEDEEMRPRRRGSRRSRDEADRGNREFDRKPERRSERSSDRRSDRLSGPRSGSRSGSRSGANAAPRRPRRIPHKVIEIDALPELAAVRLRLSEVEFTDPTVSAWRGKLRQKLGELKKLGMRYKKTQRSLETAQAEDAWRSSWTLAEEEQD